MVRAAYQLAMSSDRITSDVYEAQEFPELAQRYQVRGVPMTLVNEGEPIMGNVGGAKLLQAVLATRSAAHGAAFPRDDAPAPSRHQQRHTTIDVVNRALLKGLAEAPGLVELEARAPRSSPRDSASLGAFGWPALEPCARRVAGEPLFARRLARSFGRELRRGVPRGQNENIDRRQCRAASCPALRCASGPAASPGGDTSMRQRR